MAGETNKAFCGFTLTGGGKHEFLGKKTIYDGFKSTLGLDHVQDTSEEGYDTSSQSDLVSSGFVMVLTVSGRSGKKKVVGKLVCPVDKVLSAITALKGKKYNAWTIEKVYQSGDYSVTY
jgi:hypothetical protein